MKAMSDFSSRLVAWQKTQGRHDLPWQNTRDAYRIWVSEIMLQQTQVATVIPYYQRFMARFPDLASLAEVDEDAVLAHWSGLGYYARARNLHAAARRIVAHHQGVFPNQTQAIADLPGIGPSTAAAIAAFAFGVRGAILDGNVKRVLTRCFGIAGFPGDKAVEAQLWTLAKSLLPDAGIERYTQGLMDLGATLCTRAQPRCDHCPMRDYCIARRDDRIAQLPTPKQKKKIPERETVMLILRHGNEVLLQKRPARGIWGGLWSFPEVAPEAILAHHLQTHFGMQAERVASLPPLVHSFTHFRLTIRVLVVWASKPRASHPGTMCIDRVDALGAALPAPVRRLLDLLD